MSPAEVKSLGRYLLVHRDVPINLFRALCRYSFFIFTFSLFLWRQLGLLGTKEMIESSDRDLHLWFHSPHLHYLEGFVLLHTLRTGFEIEKREKVGGRAMKK